jgi:hypothetical protein
MLRCFTPPAVSTFDDCHRVCHGNKRRGGEVGGGKARALMWGFFEVREVGLDEQYLRGESMLFLFGVMGMGMAKSKIE